jgi:hypothetical protein
MPMVYGKGENAFCRLQEEIIKVSNDQSLFAWGGEFGNERETVGLLAKSPLQFRNLGNIVPYNSE